MHQKKSHLRETELLEKQEQTLQRASDVVFVGGGEGEGGKTES